LNKDILSFTLLRKLLVDINQAKGRHKLFLALSCLTIGLLALALLLFAYGQKVAAVPQCITFAFQTIGRQKGKE